MMHRGDELFLAEMLEASERIVELIGDKSYLDIEKDQLVQEAVLWKFSVLGEAASKVSAECKEKNPHISWKQAIAMRNRIIHGYWSVEFDLLAVTAQDDLPRLIQQLKTVKL